MRLLIVSTGTLSDVNGVRCRHWVGRTDTGGPVDVFVAAVSVAPGASPWEEERLCRELSEIEPPAEAVTPLSAISPAAPALLTAAEKVLAGLDRLAAAVGTMPVVEGVAELRAAVNSARAGGVRP